ncbi:hypothetical protein SADUNF_Sadunf01G0037300 [Salix dunnii]|uniref:Uncharacterized protein n=1 Tax=Salix dunnii TaxID=1413687 RepID=A0A835N9V2_9ROSI|nr:hypothetical protein SADUNF_Sadunf01G0037300 [Salix dunnii]
MYHIRLLFLFHLCFRSFYRIVCPRTRALSFSDGEKVLVLGCDEKRSPAMETTNLPFTFSFSLTLIFLSF